MFFNTPLNSKEKGIMEKLLFFVVSLCCLTRFQHACFNPRVRNLKTHKNVLSLCVSAKVRIVLVISEFSVCDILSRFTAAGDRRRWEKLMPRTCALWLFTYVASCKSVTSDQPHHHSPDEADHCDC